MKSTFFLLLFLITISNIFSYTNISSCESNLGDDDLNNISEREFRLNTNISSGLNCFSFDSDDLVFDCQGNQINYTGSSTLVTGFGTSLDSNITIKNCIIYDFGIGIDMTGSGILALNNSIYNARGNAIRFAGSNNSIVGIYINNSNLTSILINSVSNIIIKDFNIENSREYAITGINNVVIENGLIENSQLSGLRIFNGENVTIDNVISRNNQEYGLELRGSARNNTIVNSDFRNNGLGNIYLRTNGADNPNNNTFYSNILTSNTSIIAQFQNLFSLNTWNSSSQGNYWENYESSSICFGSPQTCDYLALPIPESNFNQSFFPVSNSVVLLIIIISYLSFF